MTMTGGTNSPDGMGPIGGPNGGLAGRLPNMLGLLLAKKRPIIMGILNVTPNSFSDGGQFLDPTVALQHAKQLIEEGADIIDIGAESTRPYGSAKPVTLEEELARLRHVLPAVVHLGTPSLDRHAEAGDRLLGAWARRPHRQRRLGLATRSEHGPRGR